MSDHTPLSVDEDTCWDTILPYGILSPDGRLVAQVSDDKLLREIVRAVNSHDKLVAALWTVNQALSDHIDHSGHPLYEAWMSAREALAAAEE